MKKVVIESPLNADSREGVEENKVYARRCVIDSLRRGEAPYASHLFYDQPGILDDLIPEEREKGILAGFAWGQVADVVAFYVDRGISRGMVRGFERAIETDADIVVRSLVTGEELYVPIEFGLPGTAFYEVAGKKNHSNLLECARVVTERVELSSDGGPESTLQKPQEP